jgi:pimeloyl-ACP methyl ester carboxylesterase
MPQLAVDHHVIAPDLPGFGFSDAPSHDRFKYTFENLAKVIDAFTEQLGLNRFALYVFDYGAPIGLRLALRHPERISAIISQNGNAYEEDSAMAGIPFRNIGRSRRLPIAPHCATFSSRNQRNGNTPTA